MIIITRDRASDISRKKKQDFAGFPGANSRKNRLISPDFCREKVKIRGKIGRFRGISAGKKSKFAEQSADFAGFLQGKSQNSWKNQPISRDFRGKKVKIRGTIGRFRGILAEKVNFRRIFRSKSADFTENFGGKLRQETISKNQLISLDFFGQISLKSINFASI